MATIRDNNPLVDTLTGTAQNDTFELDGKFGHKEISDGGGNDVLWFKSVEDPEGFSVTRTDEGVRIDHDLADGVTILWGSYAQGRFKIFYGEGEIPWSDLYGDIYGDLYGDLYVGGSWGGELEGDDDVDVLYGVEGNDTFRGGAGDDQLYGRAGNDRLYGGVGDDNLNGGAGDDTLDGGTGNDTLKGGAGIDTLRGDAGDDTLEGGADGDFFYGYTGSDTLSYESSVAGVVVNLYTNTLSGGHAAGDTIADYDSASKTSSIENLKGSAYGDTLIGDAQGNRLEGGAGADTLQGNAGDDTLRGGAGIDTLRGGAGDDTLEGGADGDFFYGYIGSDTLSYENSVEGVVVNLYANTFLGGHAVGDTIADYDSTSKTGSIENLKGSAYGDTLIGDAQGNRLEGGADNDILIGNAGDDILIGGAGADTYVFRSGYGADIIRGDENDAAGTVNELHFRDAAGGGDFHFWRTDAGGVGIRLGEDSVTILQAADANGRYSLHYGDGNTLLGKMAFGTVGNDDSFTGTTEADMLFGFAGDDTLLGGAGIDTLRGGRGDDTLEGGADGDTFYGYKGIDTLSYESSVEGVVVNLYANTFLGGHAAGDTIADYDSTLNTSSIENLKGSAYGDTLIGDAQGNRLEGGADNDILIGNAGDDILIGGAGADTYVFGSGDGADTIRGDENDAAGTVNELHFRDATGGDDFSFWRNDAGDVVIALEEDSVTILQATYANGRYSLHHGDGNTLLGKMTFGIAENDDSFTGTTEADMLFGFAGDDTLRGGAGIDTLRGGVGDDTLEGGADGDTFYGYKGSDTLSYESSVEGVVVNLYANTFSGGHAVGDTIADYDSTLNTGSIENLKGSAYGDTLIGDAQGNRLEGGEGADTLRGNAGDDILIGGAGADTYIFRSGHGADTIRGDESDAAGVVNELHFRDATGGGDFSFSRNAAGDVVITVGEDSVTILASSYADGRYSLHYGDGNTDFGRLMLAGAAGGTITAADDAVADLMLGDVGDDTFVGLGGDDFLYGGEGEDTLYGGAGNDRLEGGAGDDTYVFNAGDGTDRVANTEGLNRLVFAALTGERAEIAQRLSFVEVGSDLEISIDSDGDGAFDGAEDHKVIVEGVFNEGTEDLRSTSDVIKPFELYGGSSDSDNLIGRLYVGGAGREWIIHLGSGDDIFYGGEGNDFLFGEEGDDILSGGAGDDRLYGGAGDDKLYGYDGDDRLSGGDGDDILSGGEGDDTLSGLDGVDTLDGGIGDDLLRGGAGADTIDGGVGTDTANYYYYTFYGVRVNLLLQGQAQQDFDGSYGFTANNNEAVGDILTNIENLLGTYGNDWLTGDGGDNTLTGGSGDDRLEGGAGDDILEGDYGDDRLEGGAGADTYVFYYYNPGADTIVDEAGETMTLQFTGGYYTSYEAEDFTESSANFARVGNNLEITIDKYPDNDITDKITILDAFDTDSSTGTDNSAFTINIEYGSEGSDTFTEVTDSFWHNLLT